MQSRWSELQAATAVEKYVSDGINKDVAIRVYSTRILGQDPALDWQAPKETTTMAGTLSKRHPKRQGAARRKKASTKTVSSLESLESLES